MIFRPVLPPGYVRQAGETRDLPHSSLRVRLKIHE